MILYIVALVVMLFGGYLIWAYNGFVSGKNQIKSSRSDIDVQLKKRHNLVPQLVSTIKGYAKHEKDTFTEVTNARSAAINAGGGTAGASAQQENMLSSALKSIFAVAESYPELKANQNFLKLQEELSEIEHAIQMARRYYNGSVESFNNKVESIPDMWVAKACGFTSEEFFELENEAERKVVEVNFDD